MIDNILQVFLSFTKSSYSFRYKVLSLIPGTIVFLGVTPLVLFFISRYLRSFVAASLPRDLEIGVALLALSFALLVMAWALLALWIDGKGTPAPIAPTQKLVTTGPYGFCRNPIELGTGAYFLFLGTWFDGLVTGIFCLIFGITLGYGYIKLIEERELKLRFGQKYDAYLLKTPLFLPSFSSWRKNKHD